jgi:carbon-monoxide dehydrogenase medium subunit
MMNPLNTRLDYFAPLTLSDGCKLLDTYQKSAAVIAGGTDLMPRMRAGIARPERLIDLRALGLTYVQSEEGIIKIGACTTHAEIIDSEVIAEHLPALAAACREIAGPPIRNRGTIGGNLANASPAADSAPPLLAYDAEVVLASEKSRRSLPIADFFAGPGQTVLQPGELLVEIHVPEPPSRTAAAFVKVGKRKAMAIAVVSVAARLTLDAEGKIKSSRIALGSVASTPIRVLSAEQTLRGKILDDEVIAAAAEETRRMASPISDIRAPADYRSKMVAVHTRRALQAVREQLNAE